MNNYSDKFNKEMSSSKNKKGVSKKDNSSPVKNEGSKIKGRSIIQKGNRRIKEATTENPLEDGEILRAMGMERCNVCKFLHPLYLNRCPQCIEE
tara:strand:- start:847 stop:1128 length:282 start_codon:yes stop_codon:yes gene_type:complete